MIKTTNYEISKKLAEIGFKAETGFYWYEYDKGEEMRYIADADGAGKYKAYDLETILDNIFFVIENKENKKVYWFRMNQQDMEYITFEQEVDIEFYTPRQKGESLADTAGRMIIKLHEKNLIKF
jgi:hypothetical protein